MRSKLVMLIVLIGLLGGLRSHIIAVMFYAWVTLFRPADFSYLPLPPLVPIAFAVLTFSMISSAAQGKMKLRWNPGATHMLLIIIIAFISAILSSTPQPAYDKWVNVFKIILPSIFISMMIPTAKDFKLLIQTYAFSIGIWAIQAALYGVAGGGAVENMAIGGQMSDRNDFAVGVVMTFPLFYYLGLNEKRKYVRKALLIGAYLVALCVLVSNSRGGMLGIFLVLFLNFTRKGTKRLRNVMVMIILIPLCIPLIPDYVIERLQTIKVSGEQTEGSAKSRTILMKGGLRGAMANPTFGVGTGVWGYHYYNYVPKMGDGAYEPHCIWIKMSVELGFIGLSAYLLMFFRIFYSLNKIKNVCLKNGQLTFYNYAIMLQLALLGYCSAGTFVNQIFYEYMFLLVAASGAYIENWKQYIDEDEKNQAIKSD
ncbi:hypothetical protein DENIS_0188 [Desulfonema ishimotonii]|uniref:O-antigen polymerase n=1 Tax=Desulfonema ishimotonii TaxID=45657 RepID=A0A401FQN6_9BACT|nr:O-antigen ligase family protein [Desulfonema ishimotonii]GBC59252.1 hypothetical protein DENIS_0188 [Desulfonema ishimotonii]